MPVYGYNDYLKLIRPLPKNIKRDIHGIPVVEPQNIDISRINNGLWLCNLNNGSKKDNKAKNKIIHSFSYDDVLYRYYNNPLKFLEKYSNYYAICTFDFSMHLEFIEAQIIQATFQNRWIGAYAQANGLNVIVTLGWTIPKYYDICFAGVRDGGVYIISTLGICQEGSKDIFINGYLEARKRFPNGKFICVGNRVEGMHDDVCYVDFSQSFGSWTKYRNYYQQKLFNWDFSFVDDYVI